MLTIRPQQMRALDNSSLDLYLVRLRDWLASLVEEGETPDLEGCAVLLKEAETAGFTTEYQVAVWAACSMLAGADFATSREYIFHAIVDNPLIDATTKARQLGAELERLLEMSDNDEQEAEEEEASEGEEQ